MVKTINLCCKCTVVDVQCSMCGHLGVLNFSHPVWNLEAHSSTSTCLKPTLVPVPINPRALSNWVCHWRSVVCAPLYQYQYPVLVPVLLYTSTSTPLYQYQYSFVPLPVPCSSTSTYKLHQTVCAIDEVLFAPLAYNQQLQLCAQCLNPGHNFIKYCAPWLKIFWEIYFKGAYYGQNIRLSRTGWFVKCFQWGCVLRQFSLTFDEMITQVLWSFPSSISPRLMV